MLLFTLVPFFPRDDDRPEAERNIYRKQSIESIIFPHRANVRCKLYLPIKKRKASSRLIDCGTPITPINAKRETEGSLRESPPPFPPPSPHRPLDNSIIERENPSNKWRYLSPSPH